MPRPKGLPKTGGRKQGSLNKTTLLKEERRAIFDAQISKKWLEIIDKLKPEYIADQFMGKASDKIELESEIRTSILTPEQIEKNNLICLEEIQEAEDELKKRLIG